MKPQARLPLDIGYQRLASRDLRLDNDSPMLDAQYFNKFLIYFQRRDKREREVRRLRQLISEKKTTITTVTKGIPMTKIEVRPMEQQPNYSGPLESANPLLSGMPNATLMA